MEMFSFMGYAGTVETSIDDNVLHGKILFVNDLVTYEAETLAQLKTAFEASVTDYIETCRSIGKMPEKPVSGQFNVRIGEELHKRAMLRALTEDKSLNAVVVDAMDAYLRHQPPVQNHVHTHEHVVKVTIDKLEHAWSTPGAEMQFFETPIAYDNANARH